MQALLVAALVFGPESGAGIPRLDDLRACLTGTKPPTSDGACGPFRHGGVEYYREVDLGAARRALAVSGRFTSGIVLFNPNGAALGLLRTGELQWLGLIDLDADGEAELVGEQTVGQGTGVMSREFFILKAGSSGLVTLWSGRSYYSVQRADANGNAVASPVEQGRLAFEGQQLVYTLSKDGRTVKSSVLRLRNGVVEETH